MPFSNWVKSIAKSAASYICEKAKPIAKTIGNSLVKGAQWVADKTNYHPGRKAFEVLETVAPIVVGVTASWIIADFKRKVIDEIRWRFESTFNEIQRGALERYAKELAEYKEFCSNMLPDLDLDFSRVDYESSKATERCELAREDILRKATSLVDGTGFLKILAMKIGVMRTAAIRDFELQLENTVKQELYENLAFLMKQQLAMINETVDNAIAKLMRILEREIEELKKLLEERSGSLDIESSVVADAETTRLCCELALEILDEAEVA